MTNIVLLDPDRGTREPLKKLLRQRCGVFAVAKMHEALIAINKADPGVVICSLELAQGSEMHGLGFGKLVREGRGGAERLLIVYGVPEGKHPSAGKQDQIAEAYGLDLYIGENLAPDKLAPRIFARLGVGDSEVADKPKKRWKRGSQAKVADLGDRDSGVDMRAVLGSRSVVSARTPTVPQEEGDWSELLHRDVGFDSLKALLSKDLSSKPMQPPESITDEGQSTWGELISSPLTPETLAKLLKKEIRFDRD
jgi:hypothetical protein